ncbi:hypothetical protein KUV73_03880 [Mameliella alba]|nr:hypothetical protein [Mameliella alba]MBY6168465.1 hypothetical protein [Mameliella alba]MBY6173485.1 hypothetical protein [Mameliella alba]
MRLLPILLLASTPLHAWEFSPVPVCTVVNEAPLRVEVTYDGALYAIRLTRRGGWPDGPVFSLRFLPQGPAISTTRHVIDGETLTVTDTGFGNVLKGLQFNRTALAVIGTLEAPISLTGASEPVAAFRTCRPGPAV